MSAINPRTPGMPDPDAFDVSKKTPAKKDQEEDATAASQSGKENTAGNAVKKGETSFLASQVQARVQKAALGLPGGSAKTEAAPPRRPLEGPPKLNLPSEGGPPRLNFPSEGSSRSESPPATIKKSAGLSVSSIGGGQKHDPVVARKALQELADVRTTSGTFSVDAMMANLTKLEEGFKANIQKAEGHEIVVVYRGLLGANELKDMLESGVLRKNGANEAAVMSQEEFRNATVSHKGSGGESRVDSSAEVSSTTTVSTSDTPAIASNYARGISKDTKLWVSLKLEYKEGYCSDTKGALERELTFPSDTKIIGMQVHGQK